jgi:hypothetical protein
VILVLVLLFTISRAMEKRNREMRYAQEQADEGLEQARARRDEHLQQDRAQSVEQQPMNTQASELVHTIGARRTGERYSMLPELVSVGPKEMEERKEKGSWAGRMLAVVGLRRV